MTIEEIFYIEDASVRSINVCNNNGLNDLSTILKYYHENKTFINLRNCGRKSDEELTALCLKYKDYGSNLISELLNPKKQLISTINDFTIAQREKVNSFIEINIKKLSNRSINALTSFLNGDFKIRNISDRILTNERFKFKDIKNVGAKTVTELKLFIDSIVDFIENFEEENNENEIDVTLYRFYIKSKFSISSIPKEILESQSIFSIVDFLISKDGIFDKNENIIFQKAFNIYDNQPALTIDEIAEELIISRERVRQIRKGILKNLFANLQFLRNFDDDIYQKYSIDKNQPFINVDQCLNKMINQINNINFSAEFNSILIYSYVSDKFDILGNIEDVFQPKTFNSRDRHNWDNFYLISQDLTKHFHFYSFFDDLSKRLNDKIEENYSFHLKSYISNFLKSDDSSLTELLLSVVEKIIYNEFDLIIDLNDNIVFRRNTVKQVHEFAIEALEKIGVPSNIEDIYNLIEEDFPEITKSKEALRGSLRRTLDIIYFGRSSTYGLKKWETEKEGIKGGTIRNIVINFLMLESEPIHISKISKHVLQYRPNSNEKSIYYNLKMDESNSFIFFKNSYVGLIQKNYENAYEVISNDNRIDKKSWEERYSNLTNFLNQNGRLPFSSGCTENEIKLYRWYKVQLGKSRKRNLDVEKSILIENLHVEYAQNKSRRMKAIVTDKYKELIKFVIEKKRLPSANRDSEENLYHFFYKQRKLFEKGELGLSEKNQIIEIAKIIQNQKV
jgi:hypothetical protein